MLVTVYAGRRDGDGDAVTAAGGEGARQFCSVGLEVRVDLDGNVRELLSGNERRKEGGMYVRKRVDCAMCAAVCSGGSASQLYSARNRGREGQKCSV